MSCVYYLEGHKFDSELALNDFLLERYRFKSALGDIVFQQATTNQLSAMNTLKEITKQSEKAFSSKRTRVWDDDGKTWIWKKPYIGVNKFLSEYRDENGKRLFPTVDMENYWKGADGKSGRYADWAKGLYTDDEKELFFPEGFNGQKISSDQEFYRNKMESKWEAQCLYGDAIHSVLELYFSESNDKYIGDRLKDGSYTLDEFKQQLSQNSYENRKGEQVKFDDLLDQQKVMDTILLAEKLMSDLRQKFGEDAMFFPEFQLSGKVARGSVDTDTILGYVDLLVIDSKGVPHIIDYKTSPKHYDHYKAVKKRTYSYQLAVYGRLFGQHGFNIDKTKYLVVPIQLNEFKQFEENKFSFTTPSFKDTNDIFADISHIKTDVTIQRNLGDMIYTKFTNEVVTDGLEQKVDQSIKQWYKDYSQFRIYSDEEIRQQIEKDGGFVKNEESKQFEWKPLNSRTSTIIYAKTEDELFEKVKQYKNNLPQYRNALVDQVQGNLKKAIEAKSARGISFSAQRHNGIGINKEWFQLEMQKYCDGTWEVMDAECFKPLNNLGIIVLFNGSQYDFIRISTQDLKYQHRFGKNTTLLGGIGISDLRYKSKQNSLILPAINGNIEYMETMCAINLMENIFGDRAVVGNVQVYDPVHGLGLPASNEELYFNFNELMKNSPVKGIENHFNESEIKMASKVQLAKQKFWAIMSNEANGWGKKTALQTCYDQLDEAIQGKNRVMQLEALQKLLKTLEDEEIDKYQKLRNVANDQTELIDDLRSLHDSVVIAIADLKGVQFKQQIKDHSWLLDSTNILRDGVSGNYTDNPGNLQSETLNLITKLVTQAWQNLRSGMAKSTAQIQNATRKLVKEAGTKDTKVLYKDLYKITDDDILFKNPWTDRTLTEAQKQYLILALTEINKNRHGIDLSANTAEVNSIKHGYDVDYFRVPLLPGNSKAFTDQESLMKAFKDKLQQFHPKETIKGAVNSIISPSNDADERKSNLFEMVNTFAQGDGPDRLEYIKACGGPQAFESDLETILLAHNFAYLKKEVIDEVFPMIKASYIHLSRQGASQNIEFSQDSKYLEEYIRNKIKNESIVTPRYRDLNKVLSKLRSAASIMVLAYSPVQMFYQTIQSIWQDISLIIRKPDGTNTFTLSNMLTAAKLAYKDLFHMSDSPTVNSRINELYGINDMDINVYSDRLKTYQGGWNHWAMKFSQRPDFYSRMTIFNAKMLNDGCYYAHSIDSDGNLVYDCYQDERYAAFLKNPNGSSKEVQKAKALYIAAAKQFELENTKMPDGTLFTLDLDKPKPLPRAYTTLESESIKDISDTIYGYYSSEKKSLIHSTVLGAMWMQFRTYWSGKKNQYLATGGVKIQGKWKQLHERNEDGSEGAPLFYQVDENGKMLANEPPTTTDTGLPFMQWEGDWKEGILLTYINFLSNCVNNGIDSAWEELWYNEDPSLRATYRSNFVQLIYDFSMFALVGTGICASLGNWKDDLEENSEKDSIIDGFKLAMADIAVKSARNSFLDFNFIDSIGDPTISWSPFALTYLQSQFENIWDSTIGDTSIIMGMSKTTALTRQFTPVFKAIKYNVQ